MATADDDPSELRCSAFLLSPSAEKGGRRRLRMPGLPGRKGERRRLRMPGLTRLSDINCICGSATGVRSKEHDNRTRMTRMTRIIADVAFVHSALRLESPQRQLGDG